MQNNPVINHFAYCMAHVPDLIRYGSKPRREISERPELEQQLFSSQRKFAEAAHYPPNLVYVGNLTPEKLTQIPRPWFDRRSGEDSGTHSEPKRGEGSFGKMIHQDEFYALLREADVLEPPLFQIADNAVGLFQDCLTRLPSISPAPSDASGSTCEELRQEVTEGRSLPIFSGDELRGCFRRDERSEGREDSNLSAHILLENLCSKASGALALGSLLQRGDLAPEAVDFVISCGEEACGDRYQRGGGGMAKSIAEMCGCSRASGMDIKNFCAAPASAIVTAGALVKAGLYERVAIVGGGSLAKLGMKFQSFLKNEMPILDDCLASMAFLVSNDDGVSPTLRLEPGAVGIAPVGSSTSDEAVYRQLLLRPLKQLGLRISDVDKFAPELHNPEIMEFAGSGDVAKKNYRTIAALAVMEREIEKAHMNAFIEKIGMTGFAPTQGHIPSAVSYLGHAIQSMRHGEISRAMFLGKASIFLNRCTGLYDGVSFLLEANH